MAQAHVKGTATKITLPGGESTLLVEIAIACDVCGEHTVRFAGHHLKAIRNLTIEFIDLHPTLAGPEPQDAVRDRLEGIAPVNPSLN